ncbi:MAG: EpsG family protein [Prevotellaceae bacterium]|nr:EpsG family protein [Prevotellaceae bacterium]
MFPALLLTFFLMVYMGLRPTSAKFGDTVNYAYTYHLTSGDALFHVDFNAEWFWQFIMLTCKQAGFTVNMWFLIIEIGYLGFVFLGLRKLLGENSWMAMLFFLSAYSTFSFGTNGLRNGLACSMCIFVFAYAANKHIFQIGLVGIVLIFAFGIHRSIALPVAAFIVASYVIKSPKIAVYFWISSIGISLVAGNTVENFFMGLGFDDRMTSYITSADQDADQFSNTGFRWDFLAYSAMPIWLIWYICRKAEEEQREYGATAEEMETGVIGAGRIADVDSMKIFNILATTYILANSFWVMVIRASFSNRFAYLSWFLYPVVLAYAVIRLHIWKDQDRKAGLILVLHAGFTMFMYLVGK